MSWKACSFSHTLCRRDAGELYFGNLTNHKLNKVQEGSAFNDYTIVSYVLITLNYPAVRKLHASIPATTPDVGKTKI